MSDGNIKILYGLTYQCPVCRTDWGDVSLQPDMWMPCPNAKDDARHKMMAQPLTCTALLGEDQRRRFVKRWIDSDDAPPRTMTEKEQRAETMELEHRAKYEKLAHKIGIDKLRSAMPVAKYVVLSCLLDGDVHLNKIQLSRWDAVASVRKNKYGQYFDGGSELWRDAKGLSLAERVSLLKHVAKFHYVDPADWEGKTNK